MIPLDALSLAANVVQFVDFSITLVSKANEIRKNGVLVEHSDLSTVNRDLALLAEKLHTNIPHGVLTEDEQALSVICNGCLDVSQQLREALTKLEIKGNAGKCKSFRKALKGLWGKKRLDELKVRLVDYSNQLDRRVLVDLRTRIDWMSVEQNEDFSKLDQNAQLLIRQFAEARLQTEAKLEELVQNHEMISEAVFESTLANTTEHAHTRTTVTMQIQSQEMLSIAQHEEATAQVLETRFDIAAAIDSATEASQAEHESTRAEMERFRKEAENQVKQLREEIRLLKDELVQSIKTMVASVGKVTAQQQQRLQERSNAKFSIWAAKEILLKKLLDFLALFKFNFPDDWKFALDLRPWKITPYPRPDAADNECPTLPQTSSSEPFVLSDIPPVYQRMSLHYPIVAGNIPMLELLISNGADVNAIYLQSDPSHTNFRRSTTPLITAIDFCSAHGTCVVQLLLERGADPSVADKSGKYPLVHALYTHTGDVGGTAKLALLQSLLDRGANPSLADKSGKTPLIHALYTRDNGPTKLRLIRLLLNSGADPSALDKSGKSPLVHAMSTRNDDIMLELVQLLLEHGADPSVVELGNLPRVHTYNLVLRSDKARDPHPISPLRRHSSITSVKARDIHPFASPLRLTSVSN